MSEQLSDGQTCTDCQHFVKCKWLLRRQGLETECDWSPSRFVPVPTPDDPQAWADWNAEQMAKCLGSDEA